MVRIVLLIKRGEKGPIAPAATTGTNFLGTNTTITGLLSPA